MLEVQADLTTAPSRSELIFRAPLFRVQRGLRVAFSAQGPSQPSPRKAPTKAALALARGHRYLQAAEQGEAQDFVALALKLGVSRAWVSMEVELTFLAPKIQEAILLGTARVPSIQALVRIARLRIWSDQLERWRGVEHGSEFTTEIRGE